MMSVGSRPSSYSDVTCNGDVTATANGDVTPTCEGDKKLILPAKRLTSADIKDALVKGDNHRVYRLVKGNNSHVYRLVNLKVLKDNVECIYICAYYMYLVRVIIIGDNKPPEMGDH